MHVGWIYKVTVVQASAFIFGFHTMCNCCYFVVIFSTMRDHGFSCSPRVRGDFIQDLMQWFYNHGDCQCEFKMRYNGVRKNKNNNRKRNQIYTWSLAKFEQWRIPIACKRVIYSWGIISCVRKGGMDWGYVNTWKFEGPFPFQKDGQQ